MIYVENLTKFYGHDAAIQNVTFQVSCGERIGILGPSGAGKTSICRILTTYTPPSEGVVTIAGFDVLTHSFEIRKRIGYLPQNLSLYEDMTVYKYLDFIVALYKLDQRPKRIQAALNKVNLTPQAGMYIGKLSKTMRRWVGLAQAIIHNPDIIILDEPSAGLNPQDIIKTQQLIKTLANDYTLLLSTRSLAEAELICERVLMLNKGQIIAEDTPAYLGTRLEGGERIRLQTASARIEAIDMLQSLTEVSKVRMIKAGMFDIECICGVDCRPAVANLVVQQGWGLLELHVLDASLEDVFLEFMTNSIVV